MPVRRSVAHGDGEELTCRERPEVVSLAGYVGCGRTPTTLTGFVPDGTRRLDLLLGSGRTLRVTPRAAPLEQPGLIVVSVLPLGEAIRGATARGATRTRARSRAVCGSRRRCVAAAGHSSAGPVKATDGRRGSAGRPGPSWQRRSRATADRNCWPVTTATGSASASTNSTSTAAIASSRRSRVATTRSRSIRARPSASSRRRWRRSRSPSRAGSTSRARAARDRVLRPLSRRRALRAGAAADRQDRHRRAGARRRRTRDRPRRPPVAGLVDEARAPGLDRPRRT